MVLSPHLELILKKWVEVRFQTPIVVNEVLHDIVLLKYEFRNNEVLNSF